MAGFTYITHIMNHNKNKGFTLLEMVIVVSILGILVSIGITTYARALDQQMVNNDVELIVSAIQRARTFTLASRDPGSLGVSGIPNANEGRRYGIYFDTAANPDAYVIFYGDDTQGYDVTREIERVPLIFVSVSSVTILCNPPPLGCTGDENSIIFKRLTGDALTKNDATFPFLSPYATITIQSNRSTSLTRQIKAYPTGIVEVK